MGDFAGAYAALVQAHRLDWQTVTTATLRTVENLLAYEETRTLLEQNLSQVADQAFYAALTGWLLPPAGAANIGLWEGIKKAFTTSQGRWGLVSKGARAPGRGSELQVRKAGEKLLERQFLPKAPLQELLQ